MFVRLKSNLYKEMGSIFSRPAFFYLMEDNSRHGWYYTVTDQGTVWSFHKDVLKDPYDSYIWEPKIYTIEEKLSAMANE